METGSGYILEIGFAAEEDFSVEFYVERERSLKFTRDELLKVTTDEGEKLFALIDSGKVGRGNLMCRAEVYDKEAHWGNRHVIIHGFTGYAIGNCLCGKGGGFGCKGYNFTFKAVDDIPKDINSKIYYGVIKERVIDYKYITEEMVANLTTAPVEPISASVEVKEGDRLVVLIPYEEYLTAYKVSVLNDGVSAKLPFNTQVMGANGEMTLMVNGVKYKVFGEFIIVDGIINICVE